MSKDRKMNDKFRKPNNNKTRGNSRDNKGNNRQARKDRGSSGASDHLDRVPSWNDPAWYMHNPELAESVARLPFASYPGTTVNIGQAKGSAVDATWHDVDMLIPGIMTVNYYPTVGQSLGVNYPASVAGTQLFKAVRKNFSGTLRADAPDFVMWVLGMDGVFSYLSYLRRLYGLVSYVTSQNRFFGESVLIACGFTANEVSALLNNKIQLFSYINQLIKESYAFGIPSSIDYVTRHFWMNDKIYTDADWIRGGLYMFNPKGFFKFDATKYETGGSVSVVSWSHPSNAEDIVLSLFQFGRDLMEGMLSDVTNLEIQGYMNKAFEGVPTFQVAPLTYDHLPDIVKDEEVLMAIHNVRPVPGVLDVASLEVTQDPNLNAVISRPTTTLGDDNRYIYLKPMLDIMSHNPTAAEVLVATRLMCAVTVSAETDAKASVLCGSEIVTSVSRYVQNKVGDQVFKAMDPIDLTVTLEGNPELPRFNTIMDQLSDLTKFDWHPLMYMVSDAQTAGTTPLVRIFGDIYNLTPVDLTDLQRIHEICLYSEFNSYGF